MQLMNQVLLAILLNLAAANAYSTPQESIANPSLVTSINNYKAPNAPLSYFSEQTGITFYVESDGRHVTALASTGKILWHRNPFVDGKLEPYRVDRPVIVRIGETNRFGEKTLFIIFNSSQFGFLDYKTGEFKFNGQD